MESSRLFAASGKQAEVTDSRQLLIYVFEQSPSLYALIDIIERKSASVTRLNSRICFETDKSKRT